MEFRKIRPGKDDHEIITIYRAAFAGAPWFEQKERHEVAEAWETSFTRIGFSGVVAVIRGSVVAASWWDRPSFQGLERERGAELVAFAKGKDSKLSPVWIRDTICHPDFQGRRITTHLKQEVMKVMRQEYPPGTLVLTRMRPDNHGIIRINERMGLMKTGLQIPSSTFPGLIHDYWFIVL